MKGNHGGGLALASILFIIVLFGCCTSQAQCRAHQRLNPTTNTTRASNSVNFSVSAGNKITVVLCYAEPLCQKNCFCCEYFNPKKCYGTRDECRANCPVCNPRCPPQATMGSEGSLHTAVNSTSPR
ncbi:unnamed protein product [Urochloa decumbens]|uniref:Uncharacterized protein n=1 Tax=Urochloa decumbens TaxID=240449 RepID=A0ABC9FI96_9POAL